MYFLLSHYRSGKNSLKEMESQVLTTPNNCAAFYWEKDVYS